MKNKLQLVLDNISFNEFRIEKLSITVEVEMSEPTAMSYVGLVMEQISSIGQTIKEIHRS